MCEHGSRPAREHSRQPFAIAPDAPVTERKDAPVQHNQLAGLDPTLDQALG